jgi:protein-tyrosine phosphatase
VSKTIGRIDVHAHLLPGLDDGSRSNEESVELCRAMHEVGYTHLFCTPHCWPGMTPKITPKLVRERVDALQKVMDAAGVGVTLLPGSELNLEMNLADYPPGELVTYNLENRHAIFDFWDDELPGYFWPWVKNLQDRGLTVILAHPERIGAIQDEPTLLDEFKNRGLLLQANLQCLADHKGNIRRELVEQWLLEDRYFMLGSDLHRTDGLQQRLDGLARASKLLGEAKVWELTHTNPRKLLVDG